MKNLTLTLAQRLGLVNFLGPIDGPIGKVAPLGRIFVGVRLSEEEKRQLKITDLGNGTSRVETPTPDFGGITMQIEEADAAVLLQELESSPRIKVVDVVEWLEEVRRQLTDRR